jgi:signal transduction histidine kinase
MSGPRATTANVLIVDDTVENLRLLTSILGEQGYEVRSVTSGRQALQAVERDPPDLILLDINMPEMNGYEVCAWLKERDDLKDIPVIFLTALGEVTDKVKAFEVGGIDYVTKPFQIEEVQARVKTHIALRRSRLELARSFARLERLEKLRDDLVHMVVHDMRSPLTVLVGHLDLLRDTLLGKLGKDSADDLQAAAHAARLINRMANDLLDVSRLEEDKLPLRWAEHDVASIAEDVVQALGQLERERAIELALPVREKIACDGDLVRRTLENLVGNAIKHTPAGETIRVSLSLDETQARLTVEDRGPGIPLEARERIFDKFETIATRRAGKYHSSGLGLAFCKLAVAAHGGSIGVLPAEPRGSVFWFTLPKARAKL